MVYKRGAPEVADTFPRHRRRVDGLMMTAARDDRRAGRRRSSLDDVPEEVRRRTRSSTSSTRSAAGSPRTRPGVGARGPGDDGRARRRAAGDGDRLGGAAARGERRVRERDALPRPRLRRHALGLRQPRLDGDRTRPRSPPASSSARAGATSLAAIVAGNEVVCRIGMAASGRVPRARLPPDRDLRDLRRRRGGRAPRRARRRDDDERARDRRLVRRRASSRTSPTGRRRSRCTRPGRRTARTSRRASRTHGAAGPRSVLEGKFGLYHAFLGAEEGEIDIDGQLADLGSALGDAADRVQAVPGLPLHARLARRGGGGAARADVRAGRDRRRARDGAGGGRLARARAGRRRRGRRARSTRASSRCSTRSRRMLVRGHVAVGDFTDEAIADPAVLAVAREGALRDAGLPDLPAGVPGRRASSGSPTGRRSRPTSRTRRAGPRTRSRPTRCARSSATTPSLALRDAARRGARGGDPRARGAGRPDARRSRRSTLTEVARV